MLSFLVLLLCSVRTRGQTTQTSVVPGGEIGYFFSREGPRNDTPTISQGKATKTQCVGIMRGVLLAAGVHLEPKIHAIGNCPDDATPQLAELCSNDVQQFPTEMGPVADLQAEMLEAFAATDGQPNLSPVIKLAIRKVSAVYDPETEVIFANTYCAKCYLKESHRRVQQLPKQLLCDKKGEMTSCFVYIDPPAKVKYCEQEKPGPRASFNWDSIFVLPSDDEMFDPEAPKSRTEEIFAILQWICFGFSLVALILALVVFSSSERLRRPLPGKMMIALCAALLGALVAFFLASGVMELMKQVFHIGLRPICLTFASLLQVFLLAAFVWMALFAVELFRTFGLSQLFRTACCKFCRRRGRGGTGGSRDRATDASGLMLRSRAYESNPASRMKRHLVVAYLLPLCFAIPAVCINEYAYSILEPIYEAAPNSTWRNISQETALGSTLHRLNPGFCPYYDPRHAWFTGHQTALTLWFLAPAGSMICFNLLALFIVCVQICRLKKETQVNKDSKKNHSKSLIGVCCKLAIILGASWFLQLFAGLWPELVMLRRVAGLMNSSQGGVIAISMLAGSKARRVMARHLPARCREAIGFSESTSKQNDLTFTSRFRDQRNLLVTSNS